MDDLIKTTPADGVVTGIGCINGELFAGGGEGTAAVAERTRTCVIAYDYTVLAGTQGGHGHHKTDRILEVSERMRLPVVWFCEGGGGRPGDTDVSTGGTAGAGLACKTFATFGRLSGYVPLVGLVSDAPPHLAPLRLLSLICELLASPPGGGVLLRW